MSEDKPKRFPMPHPGVLLAVALVLVVIAVGLSVWMPYHREQVAIREIERLGGTVRTYKGGPTWLRDVVGSRWMQCFERAYFVDFSDQPISDDDLIHLNELTRLTKLHFLNLTGTQISDLGLNYLSSWTHLTLLGLEGTQVSDDGLKVSVL